MPIDGRGHDGRSIGLAAKIAADQLQDHLGFDTVDANLQLGLPVRTRDYTDAAAILAIATATASPTQRQPRQGGRSHRGRHHNHQHDSPGKRTERSQHPIPHDLARLTRHSRLNARDWPPPLTFVGWNAYIEGIRFSLRFACE
ncbi:hypothetical protein [Rhodococcus oxybenzonivorans]|uniref:hypothetical protein n=1 Tax=Rhodococcus oxybenzonivorans TaxID=1990687 RepID=UPI001E470B90|nr:hypothetical protein [Rhodococcus oxybenzonivorans]